MVREFVFTPTTYGKKHRAACVPHVGELFQNEEVELDEAQGIIRFRRHGMAPTPATPEAVAQLLGGEFIELKTCDHRNMLDERCKKQPLIGSKYCQLHAAMNKSA